MTEMQGSMHFGAEHSAIDPVFHGSMDTLRARIGETPIPTVQSGWKKILIKQFLCAAMNMYYAP